MATKQLVNIEALEMKAHSEAYGLEFPQAVEQLINLLGVQLVATIGGVSDGRWVREWKEGNRAPKDPDTGSRIRLALQMALMLTHQGRRSPRVAQAWFQGANPILDYKAPAMVIKQSPVGEEDKNLVAAARVFAGE